MIVEKYTNHTAGDTAGAIQEQIGLGDTLRVLTEAIGRLSDLGGDDSNGETIPEVGAGAVEALSIFLLENVVDYGRRKATLKITVGDDGGSRYVDYEIEVEDIPVCWTCNVSMRKAGNCYVCEGCGSTSGCIDDGDSGTDSVDPDDGDDDGGAGAGVSVNPIKPQGGPSLPPGVESIKDGRSWMV